MKSEALLIVADSEKDANMLYATGMFVPDPFIWLRDRGRTCVVMSDLEIDRARRQAKVDRVISFTRYRKQLQQRGNKAPKLRDVVVAVLRDVGIRSVTVPDNFPFLLGTHLQREGLHVRTPKHGIFP